MSRRVDPAPAFRAGHGEASDLTAVERLPILIVDDRADNLTALQAVLAPLGYPLRSAASGSAALALLLEQDCALILLDVRMAGLGGLDTDHLIRSRERNRDVPIVFLAATRDEVADMIRGYGARAIDYVLEPVDPELLRSKVAVFVELEASRRALRQSESFLRGAFDAAPIGKTVLDGARRIVRSNPAFARAVGRPPAELQGVEVAELCHESDREQLSRVLDAVAQRPAAGADDTRPPGGRSAAEDGRWRGRVGRAGRLVDRDHRAGRGPAAGPVGRSQRSPPRRARARGAAARAGGAHARRGDGGKDGAASVARQRARVTVVGGAA